MQEIRKYLALCDDITIKIYCQICNCIVWINRQDEQDEQDISGSQHPVNPVHPVEYLLTGCWKNSMTINFILLSSGQFLHMFIKYPWPIIHQFLFTGRGFFDQPKFFQTHDVGSCCLVNGIEPVLDLFYRECKFWIIRYTSKTTIRFVLK